jgi:hypothetical protein
MGWRAHVGPNHDGHKPPHDGVSVLQNIAFFGTRVAIPDDFARQVSAIFPGQILKVFIVDIVLPRVDEVLVWILGAKAVGRAVKLTIVGEAVYAVLVRTRIACARLA